MEAFWKNVLDVTGIPAWGFLAAAIFIVALVLLALRRSYVRRRDMRIALERAGGRIHHGRIDLGLSKGSS